MKIITWNCNLRLKDKFEFLEAHNPDIAIVQECESLPESFFPGARYHWAGKDQKKGLGVVDFTESSEVDQDYNENLAFFLPINLNGGRQKLLATWAFNHRAVTRFGQEYAGQPLRAFEHYYEWMKDSDLIVAGDFNNSAVWDKPKGNNNLSAIAGALSGHGLVSAYHEFTSAEFGKEDHATLYHTKKQEKPYHIDYVFLSSAKGLKDVSVGDYNTWISLSDHVPIIVELE